MFREYRNHLCVLYRDINYSMTICTPNEGNNFNQNNQSELKRLDPV